MSSAPRQDIRTVSAFQSTLDSPPLLKHIGITALVPDTWGGPWESRHQLLTRLAQYFNVVWVNPVGWWKQEWFQRKRPSRLVKHTEPLPRGFQVFDKNFLFPTFGRFPLSYISEYLRLRAIRFSMEMNGTRQHVLYLWRDRFHSAMVRGRYDLSLYHIDDDYAFSAEEKAITAQEEALIKGVDAVFISSPGLMRTKGHYNPNTVRITNGVDYEAYAEPRVEPHDLRSIPRPRIGYVGIIKHQLDVDILLTIARQLHRMSFVFVGPCRSLHNDADKWHTLAALPNVHMLGEKHFSELASYVQHLDVCMLCYKVNSYTNCIYPLKLHEYFAAGRPVIGSPLLSFQDYRDVIWLAETADDWMREINHALGEDSTIRTEARREIARRHDWNVLAGKVAWQICKNLGPVHEDLLAKSLGNTRNIQSFS